MAKPKNKSVKKIQKSFTPVGTSAVQLWFETKFKILTISVLVLAALLRIALLIELPSLPFNQLHKGPDLDMNFFDQWGDRIANGDILTDTIWHPYHSWHQMVAQTYGVKDDIEGKQKWNEWYGGKKYHQEPLYPIIIGLAKMVAGNGLYLMYILQMLLGLLTIWMIMWLGKHYYGAMAGVFAGLLFSLYSPNLLFDAVLLRTSFTTALLIGMIYVTEKLLMQKSKPWIMGLLGGTGYLLMTTSMLLWVPLVVRWLYIQRDDLKKSWQVAVAFSIILSFLILRNSITETPLLSTSSVGPITYVLSNFPKYEPELGFTFFPQCGKVMEITEGKMIPSALYVIHLHSSVWDWVWLQFKKFGAVFHWYEIPNNINSYLASEYSTTLKLAFIPYSFIAGLGVLGMIVNFRNRKTLNLLIGILSQIAIMVIFYVLCRFRVPLVAMLAIYAGYTIQQIANIQNVRRASIFALAAIVMWIIILRPFPKISALYEKGDLATVFHAHYLPLLEKATAAGDYQGGVELLLDIIQTMPDRVKEFGPIGGLKDQKEKNLSSYYGLVYGDIAFLYNQAGNAAKQAEYKGLSEKFIAGGK